MRHQNILVLGGSGFVGSSIVARLAADGRRVTLVARRRENARRLFLLPSVDVVKGDVNDVETLNTLVKGQDAVINLVGILHGDVGTPYGKAFEAAHVTLPRNLVAACRGAGVARLLHMSALGVAADAPSMYLRSKAAGEAAVSGQPGLATTIFRPAVIFGENDQFLNMFASLQKFMPVVPIGGAKARMQPVFVEDVAWAFAFALDRLETYGQTYALAGPTVYTLAELVRLAGSASGHPRPVLSLPAGLARLQAGLMQHVPGRTLLSPDNLDSLKVDSVEPAGVANLETLIALSGQTRHVTPIEQVALEYLAGRHPRTRFERYRSVAGR